MNLGELSRLTESHLLPARNQAISRCAKRVGSKPEARLLGTALAYAAVLRQGDTRTCTTSLILEVHSIGRPTSRQSFSRPCASINRTKNFSIEGQARTHRRGYAVSFHYYRATATRNSVAFLKYSATALGLSGPSLELAATTALCQPHEYYQALRGSKRAARSPS